MGEHEAGADANGRSRVAPLRGGPGRSRPIGYAGASRSHFKNRDIWHTADPKFEEMKADTTGWLGRVAHRRNQQHSFHAENLLGHTLPKSRTTRLKCTDRVLALSDRSAGRSSVQPIHRLRLKPKSINQAAAAPGTPLCLRW